MKQDLKLSFKNSISKSDLIIWILGKKSSSSRGVLKINSCCGEEEIGSILNGRERFSSIIVIASFKNKKVVSFTRN